jgi:nucleotide-binding universal stress UspA family protein
MTTAKILVATDFSAASDEALREADATARASGGKLAVVHVIPDVQALNPLFPQRNLGSELDVAGLVAKVRGLLDERITTVLGRDLDDVERFVEVGLDYSEVIRRADEWKPSILFVGSIGKTGLRRVLMGSVAEKIMRYADCPVVVVRPDGGKRGVVVAATDLSAPSIAAVKVAADQARVRKAKLVVTHAIDLSGTMFFGELGMFFGGAPQSIDVPAVLGAAKAALDAALADAKIEAEVVVANGSPAAVVHDLTTARNVELVVVGTHGRTGLARIALGSTAESIIRHVECSVLAVRVRG